MAKRVQGVNGTIEDLLALEPISADIQSTGIMGAAKAAAAALRAAVPNPPLSNMETGPVRAHIERGGGRKYYSVPNSHRLGSVHLTGPVMAVISDQARITRAEDGSMVDNLTSKFGTASRFVWPTVLRFTAQFEHAVITANKGAAVVVNSRLRKVH